MPISSFAFHAKRVTYHVHDRYVPHRLGLGQVSNQLTLEEGRDLLLGVLAPRFADEVNLKIAPFGQFGSNSRILFCANQDVFFTPLGGDRHHR